MLGLIVIVAMDTAALMLIIRVMENEDIDDWFRVGVCAVLMSIVMSVVSNVLPGLWALLGFAVAAGAGALLISALCGMSVKRAGIAAAIFWGYKIALALLCLGMFAGMAAGTNS
ncbi:MAG: hypothetical protein JNG89_10205 [Planctomycetaceae bacterium]|nr:hypothetical protein [Planctomycetaceae bacterium]